MSTFDKLNSPQLEFKGENDFDIRRERFRKLHNRLI